jgi:hypothetical protein
MGATLAVVLVAVLSILLVGPAGGAISSRTPAEVVATKSARNKSIAKRDSERRLQLLRLPPGAIASQDRPSGVGDLLRSPVGIPAGIRFVSSYGFWEVPGNPRHVLEWLRHHPPPGADLESESRGSFGRGLGFDWNHSPVGVWDTSVTITAVSRSSGGTAVRADVFGWWELPRSPAARIPHGSRYLSLRVSPGTGLHSKDEKDREPRFISTAHRPLIARLVRLINREPAYQYTVLPSCGPEALAAESHLFTLTFKVSRRGPALAQVSQETPEGPCDALQLKLGQGKTYPLFGGWQVLRAARSLIQSAVPK